MRFIIHGAGAVGSLVGGRLAAGGAQVALIARPAHVAAIKERGLLIKARDGEQEVSSLHAVTEPSQLTPRPDDVIFLTVKTAQTAHAVHQLRETFLEQTPIFCLQNGVRNEELTARRFLHVYGAMAGLCVTQLAPGVVAHTMSNTISLGNYPLGYDERCAEVAASLTRAGFEVTTHESIMAVKWSKLILNLNNATYAIIDQHLQLGLVTPELSDFMADVEEEGLHVLHMAGISVADPDNPIDFNQRLTELRSVKPDAAQLHEAANIPLELRTYPSTWTDLKERRGETEAGYFNGEIMLLGEKHNLPTPYNSTLLNVVETMALEGQAPGRYTLEELINLVEQRRLMIYHDDE